MGKEFCSWTKKHRNSFQLEHHSVIVNLSDLQHSQRGVNLSAQSTEQMGNCENANQESKIDSPDLPPSYEELFAKENSVNKARF